MDFIGDETAIRHALEEAFRLHEHDTLAAGVPRLSLPHAGIAEAFVEELGRRGWEVTKAGAADLPPEQSVPEVSAPVDSESATPRELIPCDEVIALLPKCSFSHDCKRVGVKWIARTHLHCDEHGSLYDQDAPWAEFARKEGL